VKRTIIIGNDVFARAKFDLACFVRACYCLAKMSFYYEWLRDEEFFSGAAYTHGIDI
jgi:hypothetical protein